MLLQQAVKPISYVKSHAAEIIRDLAKGQQTIVITQNGEAKAVLQDIASYEQTQESLALLKIVALGRKDLDEGRVKTAADAFSSIRDKIGQRRRS
jgi:prevent-host-death family protein